MRRYLNNRSIRDGLAVLLPSLLLLLRSLRGFAGADALRSPAMSPYLFPLLLSVLALPPALSLLAEGRRAVREHTPGADEAERESRRTDSGLKQTALSGLLTAAYCALLPLLRFIPATALFLAALMLLLGERRWTRIVPIALTAPPALYMIFALGLNVRLP